MNLFKQMVFRFHVHMAEDEKMKFILDITQNTYTLLFRNTFTSAVVGFQI